MPSSGACYYQHSRFRRRASAMLGLSHTRLRATNPTVLSFRFMLMHAAVPTHDERACAGLDAPARPGRGETAPLRLCTDRR
eukprot:6186598-Pleurochrysis_carterae.AAC.1